METGAYLVGGGASIAYCIIHCVLSYIGEERQNSKYFKLSDTLVETKIAP
jgi:hypothetical protein